MKTLIINSAKGGVGKTTITKGIAKELSKDSKVAILDLDVTTPNIPKLEGVEVTSSKSKSIPTKTALKRLVREVYKKYKDFDWLLIDTPPTISEVYVTIHEIIKDAKLLFVTTGDENAINDTRVGINFFGSRGFETIGLIQNMLCDEIGNEFDSDEVLGLPTITKIPFGVNKDFSWVDKLKELEFKETSIEEVKKIALSKMTLEEIKYKVENENLPLKFYNLESWDYIRDKLLDREYEYNNMSSDGVLYKSHFDISTEKLKEIIGLGEDTLVSIVNPPIAENTPFYFEIQPARIIYSNSVSKGLPMFQLNNGLQLWHHEVTLADDQMVADMINDGGIDLGEGRIVPSLYTILYMKRAYKAVSEWTFNQEFETVKRYKEEINPEWLDKIYLLEMLAALDNYSDMASFLKDRNEDNYSKEVLDHYDKLESIFEE